MNNKDFCPSGLAPLMLECRLPFEYFSSVFITKFLKAGKGDGHPVIVFPGYYAGNSSTEYLQNYLNVLGYHAMPWMFDNNPGIKKHMIESCVKQVKRLYEKTGRKVSLIGHSLGGLYAREIAKLCPDETRLVISLGTPFIEDLESTNAKSLYKIIASDFDVRSEFKFAKTPQVPTTSIYSKSDGIVSWELSIEKETSQSENVEIKSSHIGMCLNFLSLYVIANRLAQSEQQWKRFDHELNAVERFFYNKSFLF